MNDGPLASLLESHRVLVTCGAGGVGKTTTAAALGVAAARRGKRVLVLTIDPARRLAESLGIDMQSAEAMAVDPQRFADAGFPATGTLTAMMLDTKRTFDELVREMVEADYTSARRDSLVKMAGFQAYDYHE